VGLLARVGLKGQVALQEEVQELQHTMATQAWACIE
jgi:hypothetical protein